MKYILTLLQRKTYIAKCHIIDSVLGKQGTKQSPIKMATVLSVNGKHFSLLGKITLPRT